MNTEKILIEALEEALCRCVLAQPLKEVSHILQCSRCKALTVAKTPEKEIAPNEALEAQITELESKLAKAKEARDLEVRKHAERVQEYLKTLDYQRELEAKIRELTEENQRYTSSALVITSQRERILIAENGSLNTRITDLKAQVERMREALEWYALNPQIFKLYSDRERARQAIAPQPGKEEPRNESRKIKTIQA